MNYKVCSNFVEKMELKLWKLQKKRKKEIVKNIYACIPQPTSAQPDIPSRYIFRLYIHIYIFIRVNYFFSKKCSISSANYFRLWPTGDRILKKALLISYFDIASQLTTIWKCNRAPVDSEVHSQEAVGGFPKSIKDFVGTCPERMQTGDLK